MRLLILVCLLGLFGCQSVPPLAATPEPRPVPTIRLCGHDIAVAETPIQQELTQHVGAGMPIEDARVQLEALGFRVFGPMPKSYRRPPFLVRKMTRGSDKEVDEFFNRVQFNIASDEIGAWGQRYIDLQVFLYFDEAMKVTRLEIPHLSSQLRHTPFAGYFSRRPDLHEPIGVPVAQAVPLG